MILTTIVGTPKQVQNYEAALRSIPAPGRHNGAGGCHPNLLRVAALGKFAGRIASEVETDIQRNIPSGSRRVSENEVRQAVFKAFDAQSDYKPIPKEKPDPRAKADRLYVPRAGDPEDELEMALMDESPVRIRQDARFDAWEVLTRFFAPDEHVLCGQQYEKAPRPAGLLVQAIHRTGYHPGEFICPNPFSGHPAPKADGTGMSMRSDAAISAFRWVVCEFDDAPLNWQLAFWIEHAEKIGVGAVIHSGGKSCHGWIPVNVSNIIEWKDKISCGLFPKVLEPMGADPACKNPGRLSRLPGMERPGKGRYQKLLWLSKERNPAWGRIQRPEQWW